MIAYIQQVTFKVNWRCFQAGDVFTFRPGLNLLVGDQGSGKSSLLFLLFQGNMRNKMDEIVSLEFQGAAESRYFDFENMNPRTKSHLESVLDIQGRFISHGEMSLPFVEAIEPWAGMIVGLDEPDAALSPRSCWRALRVLERAGERNQILAAVHSPILIAGREVLSFEHRRWMPGDEFLELHRTTPAKERA